MEDSLKYGLFIFGLFIVLLFLVRWCNPRNDNTSTSTVDQLTQIIAQAQQWIFTAKQDSNPLVQFAHVNTALTKIHDVQQFKNLKITENLNQMRQQAEEIQQQALSRIRQTCPNLPTPSNVTVDMFI